MRKLIFLFTWLLILATSGGKRLNLCHQSYFNSWVNEPINERKKGNKLRGIPRYNVEFQGKFKQGHPGLCKGTKIEEESVMSDSFSSAHKSRDHRKVWRIECAALPLLSPSPAAGAQPLSKECELLHLCRDWLFPYRMFCIVLALRPLTEIATFTELSLVLFVFTIILSGRDYYYLSYFADGGNCGPEKLPCSLPLSYR